MQTYVVQKGDTLYGISKQFGVTVENIKAENNLTSDFLNIGQSLLIPTSETTFLYIVKVGDTLYSIASKYNVSVLEIISINDLKSNVIGIGQQLRIPINSSEEFNYVSYTVVAGDNLYSIAKKYDTSVDELKKVNGLASNLLSIGQVLKIPMEVNFPDEYDTYIVKSGDTLYAIAKKYDMSVEELKWLNNLTNNNLSIGQVLKVYVLENDSLEGLSCYGEGYSEPTYITYTVKAGDSLYVIGKKYGVSVDNLMKLNNLTDNNLSIGQVLKIKEVS